MYPWALYLPFGVMLLPACLPPMVQITAGQSHTCQLFSDGGVLCWGANPSGQSTPPPDLAFEQISAAHNHTCGLDESGAVHCWGRTQFAGLDYDPGPWRMVDTGHFHTCALDDADEMRCWGPSPTLKEQQCNQGISGKGWYRELSAGALANCATKQNGGTWCWGPNTDPTSRCQGIDIGIGTFADRDVAQISTGYYNHCQIQTNLVLTCENGWFREESWTIPEGEEFLQIDLAHENGCALDPQRRLRCWGPDVSDAPEGTWLQVAVGAWHACALDETGRATCWGRNDEGQTDVPY